MQSRRVEIRGPNIVTGPGVHDERVTYSVTRRKFVTFHSVQPVLSLHTLLAIDFIARLASPRHLLLRLPFQASLERKSLLLRVPTVSHPLSWTNLNHCNLSFARTEPHHVCSSSITFGPHSCTRNPPLPTSTDINPFPSSAAITFFPSPVPRFQPIQ